jgi:succinate dehydrogenase/fumarate reductase cytochrome b subunit
MFTVVFVIALALSAVAALPADWARRNASRELANLLNLANVTATVAIVALAAAVGAAHGLGGILGLVSGAGTGQQLADVIATRRWGRVPVV